MKLMHFKEVRVRHPGFEHLKHRATRSYIYKSAKIVITNIAKTDN
jgi:hypothetical protein